MARQPNDGDAPDGFVRVSDMESLVQKKVEDAVFALMSEKGAGAPVDASFAQALAVAIAQMSDQGTNRKRVAPEVMHAREAARDKMLRLIVDARERGEVPFYRLQHKVHLDDMLVDPQWVGPDHVARPTEIEWPGVPNEAMSPLNEIAKEIHAAFCDSIGSAVKAYEPGPMRVTARGLVIMGQAPRSRDNAPANASPSGEGLRLRGRGQPGALVETRILGTMAEPARQNA